VVIASAPGGYTAAFYAADLGKKVILIERDNDGRRLSQSRCIPPTLLNAAHSISAAREPAIAASP